MSWFAPTNQELGLAAQHALLKHFLKTEFEVKSTSFLNYVEFKVNEKPNDREERILVLTHGYGSGLGFFFGKSNFISTFNSKSSLHQDLQIIMTPLPLGLIEYLQ
jgi:hypothetical protein